MNITKVIVLGLVLIAVLIVVEIFIIKISGGDISSESSKEIVIYIIGALSGIASTLNKSDDN